MKSIRVSLIAVVSVLALIGAACSSDNALANGQLPGGSNTPVSSGAITPHINLTEFAILGDLRVPEGNLNLDVLNKGGINHTLALLGGPSTGDLASGQSADLALGQIAPGEYELFCEIPGHKEAGMVTNLTVVDSSQAGDIQISATRDEAETDWEALDKAMMESISRFPSLTEGSGNQVLEPTVLADGTKEFNLTAAITSWEVETGKFVEAWTYNGQVPGPQIKVDVGDKVRVNVQNDLPMGTDVHWHGIQTPNNMDGVAPLTQDLIYSGESFVYEFEARRQSIGMYHAHHHGQMQIPNGMFGVFIIGDMPLPYGKTIGGTTIPDDLVVAQEIPMVLNDAGVIGFSLNGKSFPSTDPFVVNKDDWIVINYYNEGLQIHPMHMHQFPQLVFAKDGFPLDHPYYADTINVAPGERFSVLVRPDEAGAWVWHCHILTHVEREEGMFGMVTALIVQDV